MKRANHVMETLLYIIHVIVCLALLPIILLQSGKGGGVGAGFGGGGAQTVLGTRGASTFLTRMTTGAAIIFMCTSLGLAYTSSTSKSVVGDVPSTASKSSAGNFGTVPAPANAGGGRAGDDVPADATSSAAPVRAP